ncbi:MAG: phosphoglycerate kinase [bacterium]
MNKKTIRDINVKGKRVLMRVDFNVPLEKGVVTDDTRIKESLPSIRYILEQGGSLVLMSHLGRPKGGKPEPEFSLKPAAERLQLLLGRPVGFAPDCVGAETKAKALALKPGEILLLENTRFYKEEEGKADVPKDAPDDQKKAAKAEMKKKQEVFAKQLSELGDLYVNDAFGSAHRAHASTAILCKFFKENVAGFLMEKELDFLGRLLANPERPYVVVLGGAKVEDKVKTIMTLLERIDVLLIGGAMAYVFYLSKGIPVGNSKVEKNDVPLAKEILAKAEAKGVKLLLPVDHVIADKFDAAANTEAVGEKGIRDGWMALDIGPKTAELFGNEIAKAKTVFWNGPMGCFEMKPFAAGTMAVAKAVAGTRCLSVVGGGDSVKAINRSGLASKFSHISTGGGASLEFLEGKELPGVATLNNK